MPKKEILIDFSFTLLSKNMLPLLNKTWMILHENVDHFTMYLFLVFIWLHKTICT